MATVKTGLKNMSATARVQLARRVVTKMTGNATFAAPAPSLSALAAAADALEAATNAALALRASSKEATSIQADRDAALAAMLVQEAAYVQNITAGDKTKIESSGYDVRNSAAPVGALPAPVGLQLNVNTNPGMIEFKWKGVKGAMSYIVELAADHPVLSWQAAATPTKPRAVVGSLTSGVRYWVRVAAVGAAGRGMWTGEVSRFAP